MGLGLMLTACASIGVLDWPGRGTGETQPAAWATTADGARRLAAWPVSGWGEADPDTVTLRVDPTVRYQRVSGFGAAITDSSAWLIRHRLDEGQREALMSDLFGRQGGIGLSAVRLTIGASDFSLSHYSYRDDPAAAFSLEPALESVVPVTLAAAAINPELTVIASPWSAPGWMKTSGGLVRGSLSPDHYGDFARYLVDYVVGMREAGVDIDALTIQNEPHFEPANYPGMRVPPAARAAFIGGYLGPLLASEGLEVDVLDWDHNWNEPESPLAVLSDPIAGPFVAGVAWHCYEGEVPAQSRVREAHPDKSVWLTECSGGAWEPDWGKALAWLTRNLIIGGTRNWAEGVLFWNLALDEKSGPHAGGCGDCRGVVTINGSTGEVTRNVEYYALAHASRFTRPGARRIESDSGVSGLESVAFRNEDDGSIALVVFNGGAAQRFQVVVGWRAFAADLPAGSVATFTWREARPGR
ncbi:MAG: glycoside hydrolase family 30 protein [Pseudomonadota bacterium]